MLSLQTSLSGHEAAVYALCAWKEGVLSGGGDGYVVHWPLDGSPNGQLFAQLDDRVVALLPCQGSNSLQLVVGTLSGDMYWIDPARPAAPRRWQLHEDGLFGLVQLHDEVFAVGGKGRLSKWSVSSGEMIVFVQLDSVRLRSICYLSSISLLAIGTANGDIHIVDPRSLRIIHTIVLAHERTIFSLVDGGDHFYTAGRDGAIRSWRCSSPFDQLDHVAAHASTVNSLLLSPKLVSRQDPKLISVGRDREIRVWTRTKRGLVLAKAVIANRDDGHVASVNACCIANQSLITGGDDRVLKVWTID